MTAVTAPEAVEAPEAEAVGWGLLREKVLRETTMAMTQRTTRP